MRTNSYKDIKWATLENAFGTVVGVLFILCSLVRLFDMRNKEQQAVHVPFEFGPNVWVPGFGFWAYDS